MMSDLAAPGTSSAAAGIRGDLLSCYITATAGLLAAQGVDPIFAVGAQLFLGVRWQDELAEFLHYHTPLAGDGTLYRIGIERHGVGTAQEAADRITAEAQRAGVAMVAGCAETLPWLDHDAGNPAPHWFLVRPDAAGRLRVDDRFSWIDDLGEHPGYLGTIDSSGVGALSYAPVPATPEHVSRECWALGDRRDRPEWSTVRPWQWFECTPVSVGDADPVEVARVTLLRTVACELSDPAVAAAGWTVGEAAFSALAEFVANGINNPATYRYHNDFWITARNRQMFSVTLRSAHEAGVCRGLPELADWIDQDLTPAWTGLVRAMRYNSLRAERGMRARPAVLEELRRIGALEAQLRERLAAALPAT